MDHNSYKSPISINKIDWSLKEENFDFYKYTRDLIEFRKRYDEFTLDTTERIKEKIRFFHSKDNLIAYTIKRDVEDEYLLIFHNGNGEEIDIEISSIKADLEKAFDIKVGNIRLTELFNFDGIVEEKEIQLEKINILQYSNNIYKISSD